MLTGQIHVRYVPVGGINVWSITNHNTKCYNDTKHKGSNKSPSIVSSYTLCYCILTFICIFTEFNGCLFYVYYAWCATCCHYDRLSLTDRQNKCRASDSHNKWSSLSSGPLSLLTIIAFLFTAPAFRLYQQKVRYFLFQNSLTMYRPYDGKMMNTKSECEQALGYHFL